MVSSCWCVYQSFILCFVSLLLGRNNKSLSLSHVVICLWGKSSRRLVKTWACASCKTFYPCIRIHGVIIFTFTSQFCISSSESSWGSSCESNLSIELLVEETSILYSHIWWDSSCRPLCNNVTSSCRRIHKVSRIIGVPQRIKNCIIVEFVRDGLQLHVTGWITLQISIGPKSYYPKV